LEKADLTERVIADREARIGVHDQIRMLEAIGDALQDDVLGFHLASTFDLREIGLLYYVLASSDELGDALIRTARYSTIVNEGISVRCREGGEFTVAFHYVGVERRLDRHQIEFWLTALVRICRQLANRRLTPVRARLMHRRRGGASELDAFLGCAIDYGADADELVFPNEIAGVPVVSADRYLNDILLGYCEDALSERSQARSGLRPHLENTIAPLLPHGKARAGEIARRLGMSQRTLTRRLSSEGLTFGGVLDAMKADLARHYLRDDDLSISEIAWLLGYREVSAFTHAFKRWTGVTPREARAQGAQPHMKAG
jgi:AraC-like DNA-binding protein